MRPPTFTSTSIPSTFHLRKSTILHSLARSSETYTDLSPKGSIDVGIRPLIERLNALDGIVTTSSCAGRISVFLEGEKTPLREGEEGEEGEGERAVPGGKGRGGRWLFVSHDPINEGELKEKGSWGRVLGVDDGREREKKNDVDDGGRGWCELDVRRTRFVRFQFEPMILHILTASLHHAQPILSAAINAGFRESGIQSLKNLQDPQNSLPMVAVRSTGLALGAIIGYSVDPTVMKQREGEGGEDANRDEEGQEDKVQSIVSEEYLGVLVRLANERFEANRERMRRFEEGLFGKGGGEVEVEGGEGLKGKGRLEWEDKEARGARKRAEGLAIKAGISEKTKRKEQEMEEDAEKEEYMVEPDLRFSMN